MSKNRFLAQYLELPDKAAMRFMIFAGMLLVNIIDFMVLSLTEINLLNFYFYNYRFLFFLVFAIIFDVWALSLIIFIDKFGKQFYLFTATAFTATSIFCFFETNKLMFLDFGLKAIIFSIISILIYILIVVTVISNIRSKIKNRRPVFINTRNTSIVSLIGAITGVFLIKPVSLDQSKLPLIIVLLLLSYLFTFTISGFHKFYLICKMNSDNRS